MYIWSSVLVAILLGWAGYRAYLAHQNLVTLNVRDAEVRDVIRKCEWQTWETIVVDKNVKGKVTLNVRSVPLEEVLGIIGDQTSSRSTAIYPIYSKSKSIVNLRKLARGELEKETAGWTNFNSRGGGGGRGGPGGPGGFGGMGGMGGFGDTARSQNSPVTLNVPGKDISFAVLALSRWSQAQVVPEDGATALITLSLSQVPFREAVAKVAKQAHRKWEVFYALQARPDFFGRGEGEDRGGRGGPDGGLGRNRRGDENDTNRQVRMDERAIERQIETEARLATMTPEEQAKAREEQQKFEEIRNLPPEQQRQQFEEMVNNPQNQQRMENRANSNFKNSTPAQRVEQASRRSEMRNRRQRQTQ